MVSAYDKRADAQPGSAHNIPRIVWGRSVEEMRLRHQVRGHVLSVESLWGNMQIDGDRRPENGASPFDVHGMHGPPLDERADGPMFLGIRPRLVPGAPSVFVAFLRPLQAVPVAEDRHANAPKAAGIRLERNGTTFESRRTFLSLAFFGVASAIPLALENPTPTPRSMSSKTHRSGFLLMTFSTSATFRIVIPALHQSGLAHQ
ncbi:hypothetical protein BD779DRAFT_1473897 [Infundibulicybe gibba]|nr:hypothetical protein BD779DRAFT_1473897 [Infundibulicybe gibba]